MESKVALDNTPQRETTRSPEHGQLEASSQGREVKREGIPFHRCALAPDQAKRSRIFCLVPSPCICHLVYLMSIYSHRL